MKISTADLSPEYVRSGASELTASKISYSSETIENNEKSEWYSTFIYYNDKNSKLWLISGWINYEKIFAELKQSQFKLFKLLKS